MPSGKPVTPLFGILAILLNPFFLTSENKALADSTPYIVVIDPGHGGEDKGAVGKLGKKTVYEKDIALGIAIRTSRVLSNPKYWRPLGRRVKTVLTRDRDREISLEERSELARSLKAHLFVSIHSNSDTTGHADGVETYFLNNTDDESSKKLEEIENRTAKERPPEALVLRSVAADAWVDASRVAARTLHQSVIEHLRVRDGRVHDRGVKQAMLYVLLDSQVPAVLFEAFFMSHKKDLAYLSEGANRQKIAEGLAKGILRYLATQ